MCTMDELTHLLHTHGLKLYGAALTDTAQDLRRVLLSPAAVAIGSEGRGPERAAARTVRRADHHPHAAGSRVAQRGSGRGGRHVGDCPRRDVEEDLRCRSCNTGSGCPCASACDRR